MLYIAAPALLSIGSSYIQQKEGKCCLATWPPGNCSALPPCQGDAPVVWRGPIVNNAIDRFLMGTAWGNMNVLVVDMPPGEVLGHTRVYSIVVPCRGVGLPRCQRCPAMLLVEPVAGQRLAVGLLLPAPSQCAPLRGSCAWPSQACTAFVQNKAPAPQLRAAPTTTCLLAPPAAFLLYGACRAAAQVLGTPRSA